EWMPDGKHLLTEGRGPDAVLWSIPDGSAQVLAGSGSFFCVSDDGDLLAERSGAENFRVWSLSSRKELLQMKCPDSWHQELRFLPGTRQIAVGESGVFRFVDCDTGKTTGAIKADSVYGVSLAVGGSRLATISYDMTQVRELGTKRKLSEFVAKEDGGMVAGDLTSDGSLLFLRRENKGIELHVAETGETVWSMK